MLQEKKPISKEREQNIKKFLSEAEKSILKLAEARGLEVYVETDTRGKLPYVGARVLLREFLRDGKRSREVITKKGSSIAKRVEVENVSGEQCSDGIDKGGFPKEAPASRDG